MKTLKNTELDLTVRYDEESNAQFQYCLVGDTYGEDMWFRHNDGMWSYLCDGPGTTVDRETLVTEEYMEEWDREGWVPREVWGMLAELRTL